MLRWVVLAMILVICGKSLLEVLRPLLRLLLMAHSGNRLRERIGNKSLWVDGAATGESELGVGRQTVRQWRKGPWVLNSPNWSRDKCRTILGRYGLLQPNRWQWRPHMQALSQTDDKNARVCTVVYSRRCQTPTWLNWSRERKSSWPQVHFLEAISKVVNMWNYSLKSNYFNSLALKRTDQ